MFEGLAVALVTPFTEDDQLDTKALETLIDFHVKAGTECILVCGTTGESATLTHDEHKALVKHAAQYVRSVRGEKPTPLLWAGTGSNNTREAVELTAAAKEDGADAALLISPYYNKPPQTGLLAHFRKVAQEVDIPQVVYNIQGRTAVNISAETMVELSHEKNIVGVKESSGNFDQVAAIIRDAAPGFTVWSGDDGNTLPIMAMGGKGVVSVTANIMPGPIRELVHAYLAGKPDEAKRLHHHLAGINAALFYETNPIPVKTAVNWLSQDQNFGLPHCGNLRLPLVEMSEANQPRLREMMKRYSLPV